MLQRTQNGVFDLQHLFLNHRKFRTLNSENIQRGTHLTIHKVRSLEFPSEINFLITEKPIYCQLKIISLNLFVDEKEVTMSDIKLKNSKLS